MQFFKNLHDLKDNFFSFIREKPTFCVRQDLRATKNKNDLKEKTEKEKKLRTGETSFHVLCMINRT